MNRRRKLSFETLELKRVLSADPVSLAGPDTLVSESADETAVYASQEDYSRVKVQFYWDREGAKDENSSCWIRVAQQHASGSGDADTRVWFDIDRTAGFSEGDPDLPLVVGRVYSAEAMPPYELPGAKSISGLRSNSSPGGGAANSVQNNETVTIGRDRIAAVGSNETTTTDGPRASGDVVVKGKCILEN